MFSKSTIVALCASAVAVSAQSSTPTPTATILLPGFDGKMDLVASVVSAEKATTTYFVKCGKQTGENECGLPPDGMNITQGPATMVASTVLPADTEYPMLVTYGWECSIGGTTAAVCTYRTDVNITESVNSTVAYHISTMMGLGEDPYTTKYNDTELKTAWMPATITAGAEKLAQQTGDADKPKESGAAGEANADKPKDGAASMLQAGGLAIGAALAAVLML